MTATTNNVINKNDYDSINTKLESYNKYYNSLLYHSDKGSVYYNQTGENQGAGQDACAGYRHMCGSHVKNGAKWANFSYKEISQANRKPKNYGTYETPTLPETDTIITSGTISSTKTSGHIWAFRNELKSLWGRVTALLGSAPESTNYDNVNRIASYTNTQILASHINNIDSTLSDVYNKLESVCRNFYDAQGFCNRSCQVNCQFTCQVSCMNYCKNCHNQHCGLA